MKIKDAKHFELLLRTEGMVLATTVPRYVIGYFNQQYEDNKMQTIVLIPFSLLSESYLRAPGMFATLIRSRVKYEYLNAVGRGKFLRVRAGEEKAVVTFRSKLLQGLQNNGEFEIDINDVPISYFRQPQTFCNKAAELLEGIVSMTVSKGVATWKLTLS